METRPNETFSEAIDRAAMAAPAAIGRVLWTQNSSEIKPSRSGLHVLQDLFQALLARQGLGPAIAGLRQPVGRIGDPEVERMGFLELLPGEGHRYRGPGQAPGRVCDVQRLAADVHVVVHENLAG